MTAINPQTVNLDTIALTTASAAIVSKLQEHFALAVLQHPALHIVSQLWPLVLVAAGLVLLVTSHSKQELRQTAPRGDNQ